MSHRRTLLATTSAVALAASVLIPAQAASASGDCQVSAHLPDTYSITSSLMTVPAALDDPADCSDWASYDIVRGDGAHASSLFFETSYSDTWLLGSSDGPGEYQAVFDSGYDWDSEAIWGTDSNTMTAKFGSALRSWSGKRDKRKKTVTLKVRALDYSYADYGWGPGARRVVTFERRTAAGGWEPARTVTADRNGWASAKVKSGSKSVWRAVLLETGTAWEATSGTHTH